MAGCEQWLLIGDELNGLDRLVCMVVPDVFRGRADLVPAAASVLRGPVGPEGQEKAVQALYELLAAHGLRYDMAPADPAGVERQKIRQPREVFAGRRANCLDLALVFCGMALEAQLSPVLAVMVRPDRSRHAVVLIAPQAVDDPAAQVGSALRQGPATAAELGLAELLGRGWTAVDVTLVTDNAESGPADVGTFAEAREAARSALASARSIRILDIARRQGEGLTPFAAEELPPPAGQPYSAAVQKIYGPVLAREGVVPVVWNTDGLHAARARHRAERPPPSAVSDTLDALCAALEARPVFTSVGGDRFALAALQHLYADHVGQWPRKAHTVEELLVLAAAADMAEFRSDARRTFGPLARFLLAVAGHAEDPRDIDLESARYALLDTFLIHTLGHLREDARQYLLTDLRTSSWALLDLDGCEGPVAQAGRPWPSRVVVDLVDARGTVTTKNFPCRERSEEGLKEALRRATAFLPGRGVTVDIVAPRAWLDAGIEHWDVVEVEDAWDPMTRDLQPRMRWSGFKHERLRERLDIRLGKADWHGSPAVLPEAAAADRKATACWLGDPEEGPGPPYYVACPPPGGSDALAALLSEGCGFIVWFTTPNEETVLRSACVQGNGQESAKERRSRLPRQLARQLAGQRTAVVWNDPAGRDGFSLPPARRSGSLRRGGRR
ncbi:hypothetical protein ACH4U3_19440 [Streptomyces griseoruber]|uniref:hypothetical protein n=1 Tax=Streptomyces griseoruber TaxID=1943 RepID=UPI0037A8669F